MTVRREKTEEPLEQHLLLVENREGGTIPVIPRVMFGGEPRLKGGRQVSALTINDRPAGDHGVWKSTSLLPASTLFTQLISRQL